ncbi:hypothetical protein BDM02DRAFT_3121234 [Thelephora ganbajun]|uniref:Uncharacterized protein n=1 Tax=Thelephora ganbajun TaxID=370292 RepID=A0ACB6Z6D5_THEGA|nr:hypothetical protein BDM02DRAFT_3121234 [Thelephora ganbajun]
MCWEVVAKRGSSFMECAVLEHERMYVVQGVDELRGAIPNCDHLTTFSASRLICGHPTVQDRNRVPNLPCRKTELSTQVSGHTLERVSDVLEKAGTNLIPKILICLAKTNTITYPRKPCKRRIITLIARLPMFETLRSTLKSLPRWWMGVRLTLYGK